MPSNEYSNPERVTCPKDLRSDNPLMATLFPGANDAQRLLMLVQKGAVDSPASGS